MKNVLITGAGSFIGTSFEKYIEDHPQRDEIKISVMDTLTGKIVSDRREKRSKDDETKDDGSKADGIKADGSKADGTWDLGGFDTIFHVAGIAHADVGKVSEEGKELYRKVNTDLTTDIAKAAKAAGVGQFIFMSSSIVYGASSPIGKGKLIDKDTKPVPENFYGESKLNAEIGLEAIADKEAFKVVILRPPMIYGPGCKGNYNALRKFALKMPLFPKVDNERSMLYIDNLCEFVRLMIVNEECGIFHPANREIMNTSKMVGMIAKAHGRDIKLVRGFTWLLKILSHFTGLVNKAFGNLSYEEELTRYKADYNVVTAEDSIIKTENSFDQISQTH